jgi:UDP-N-acetylmuramate--alanine ligase
MAVLTNIDQDHMETYDGDYSRLKQTYLDFLHNLPFYGLAVVCFDDPDIREITERLRKPFITYGLSEDVEYRAVNISQSGRDSIFEVIRYGESIGKFRLALPGRHNVLNALAAIVIGYKLELPAEAIRDALSGFQGIGRRFQQYGLLEMQGKAFELVDDYAHHPTEIEATLRATRDCWPECRILVVFQPHRFSRTRDLFDDFATLLAGAGDLIVTEVYAAGEAAIAGSDGRSLCRAIRKRGSDPVFVESMEDLTEVLPGLIQDGDVVLTLGAGSIGRFAQNLAEEFSRHNRSTANDG